LFGPLLEEVQDAAELPCALRTLYLLHRQRGALRFITASALAGDVTLLRALQRLAPESRPQELLERALEAWVARGLFLRLLVQAQGRQEALFFLNTPANQRAMERIRSGELSLPSLPEASATGGLVEAPPRRDIFALYEENIGPIYPMAAERLKELEKEYPPGWMEDAFREAVRHNRRKLAYIEAILREWKEHGRGDGTPGRRPQKVPVTDIFRRARR
jgi:DnaD/phage-associated family protein